MDVQSEVVFFEFAETAIEHIRTVYPNSEGDVRKDLLELAESYCNSGSSYMMQMIRGGSRPNS